MIAHDHQNDPIVSTAQNAAVMVCTRDLTCLVRNLPIGKRGRETFLIRLPKEDIFHKGIFLGTYALTMIDAIEQRSNIFDGS